MKLPGLFRELAVWPNWATGQEGPWSGRWARTQWPPHSDRTTEFLGWDGRTCRKDNNLCSPSHISALWESGQTEATFEKKAHDSMPGVCKMAHERLKAWGKRSCGLMRRNFNCLAWIQSATSGGNRAQLSTHLTPSLPWRMVVAESCCGYAFQWQGLGDL